MDETEDKYEARTLFPGTSCYPLSPCPKGDDNKVTIDPDDQLFKILEHKPHTSEDFSFIKDKLAQQYVISMNDQIFHEKPRSEKKFMGDLISHMLEFNPNNRWTAKQCLNHPVFDKIKKDHPEILNMNINAPFKI